MLKLLPKVCLCVYIYMYVSVIEWFCATWTFLYVEAWLTPGPGSCLHFAGIFYTHFPTDLGNFAYKLTSPLFSPSDCCPFLLCFAPKSILLPPQQIAFPLPPVSARQGQVWWVLARPHLGLFHRTAPSLPALISASATCICSGGARHEGSQCGKAASPQGWKHMWGERRGWSG